MKEFKLSDRTKIILHEDGHLDIVREQWSMELTVAESREMANLMLYEEDEMLTDEQVARLTTAKPMYEPDSVDSTLNPQCPSCKEWIVKNQLLKSPIGVIFCQQCKHEDCEDCMMEKWECICV